MNRIEVQDQIEVQDRIEVKDGIVLHVYVIKLIKMHGGIEFLFYCIKISAQVEF